MEWDVKLRIENKKTWLHFLSFFLLLESCFHVLYSQFSVSLHFSCWSHVFLFSILSFLSHSVFPLLFKLVVISFLHHLHRKLRWIMNLCIELSHWSHRTFLDPGTIPTQFPTPILLFNNDSGGLMYTDILQMLLHEYYYHSITMRFIAWECSGMD